MWIPAFVACAQASGPRSKWWEISIHQHVLGTPWFGMDAIAGRQLTGAHWVAGLHHQGWAAWQRHSVSGGQHKVFGELAADVLVQVGVDRWPQVQQADPWATPLSDGLGGTRGCFKRQAGADGCFTSPTLLTLPRCTAWPAAPDRGGVPFQMRLAVDNRTAILEARVRPKPGWRLTFTAGEDEAECGVRHEREWGQVEVTIRHSDGGWALVRQVKMTHKVEGPRRARLGMLWMEGVQGGATQRAVFPWAERMTWMQTPAEGARASLWAAWNDNEGSRTWSVHAAWAPSQQVAFRCALRLSWEA